MREKEGSEGFKGEGKFKTHTGRKKKKNDLKGNQGSGWRGAPLV